MLEYKLRPTRKTAVAAADIAGPVVILHGFGASSSDLYPLADELDPHGALSWYFPEAPYTIRYHGSALGKAWFPRNESEMAGAVEGIYFHRLEEMDPEGLRRAGAEVGELVESLDADWEQVILGGFSQGAMVAVEAVAQAGRPPADLLLFSGSVIALPRWSRELRALGGFRFFQSHGTTDPILPFDGARKLFSLLEEAGGEAEFLQFDGGHAIPREIIERVGRRLRQQLPDTPR